VAPIIVSTSTVVPGVSLGKHRVFLCSVVIDVEFEAVGKGVSAMSNVALVSISCSGLSCLRRCRGFAVAVLLFAGAGVAQAGVFDRYQLDSSFSLPAGSSAMTALPDGRVIAISGGAVFVETATSSRTFSLVGTLPGADISGFGAAFLSSSADGALIAVGNNGGASGSAYEVGVFEFPGLVGTWFSVNHFTGTWIDDRYLAIAAGDFSNGEIVALDVTSPDAASPVVVTLLDGIGGASGGIAFDSSGNLFTANGFMGAGPSGTGAVKAFAESAWRGALEGGSVIDFESTGQLVVDILSGTALGFDVEGNLHVAGGDFSISKIDFVALARRSDVLTALSGGGALDISDANQVRRFDPDGGNAFNFYDVVGNTTTRELLLRSAGETTVHVYVDPTPPIPAVSEWGLATMALLALTLGTLAFRQRASCAVAIAPQADASYRWDS
jgi:hypothetical protein